MKSYLVKYMFFKQSTGIKSHYGAVIVQTDGDEDEIVRLAKELAQEKERVASVKIGTIEEC